MNRLAAVYISVLLTFVCFSCASSNHVSPASTFKISKITLAKGINESETFDVLVTPTDTFSTHDDEIIAHIEFANLTGSHELKWEWYDPNGKLYMASRNHVIESPDGQYIAKGTAWHTISVKGEKAELYPGAWNVGVFFDNAPVASETFRITTAPGRKGFAVIVGISKYRYAGDSLPNLPFADDDARAVLNMLKKLGWDDDHIKYLTDEQATYRNITIALESWLTKAKGEDLVLLYWSGHGFPDPENPEKVYFACYDTHPGIPATGYRMDRVISSLKERNTKNVVVFADTCHAGKLITRGKKGLSLIPYVEQMKHNQKVPIGWIYMVSAETDRQAIEHSSWSNGAFTHCLIKALSGEADGYESIGQKDKTITMGELRAYMASEMPNETLRVLGVAKHPVITTSTGDPAIWQLNLQLR